MQVQAHDFVTCNNLVSEYLEHTEYDLQDTLNQMDATALQLPTHDVSMSPKTQRHPEYASPETDLYSHAPILNEEQLCRMYSECFNGIGTFENY